MLVYAMKCTCRTENKYADTLLLSLFSPSKCVDVLWKFCLDMLWIMIDIDFIVGFKFYIPVFPSTIKAEFGTTIEIP